MVSWSARQFRRPVQLAIVAVVAAAAIALGYSRAPASQQRPSAAFRDTVIVRLRSGDLQLTPALTDSLLAASRIRPQHGFAAFSRRLTTADRDQLRRLGMVLVAPVGARVHQVRAHRVSDSPALVAAGLLGAASLRPQDRIEPFLRAWLTTRRSSAARPGATPAVAPDGAVHVRVVLHAGTGPDNERRALELGRNPSRLRNLEWSMHALPDAIAALSRLESVAWIDMVAEPRGYDNDVTRTTVGVELLQAFSVTQGEALGLSGAGVRVGVFDGGLDEQHKDFGPTPGTPTVSRIPVTNAEASLHGTLVAGVIAGNGTMSEAQGGSKYRWRGMAPSAHLLDVWTNLPTGSGALVNNLPLLATTFRDLIVAHEMFVSNHSYELELAAQYGARSSQRDSMIRGDAQSASGVVPRRAQVFSAGNFGGSDGTTAFATATIGDHGYFGLNWGELKNSIAVGDWDAATGRTAGTSSLGPTQDGRVKPDLVAPGTNVRTTGYWKPGTTVRSCTQLPAGIGTGSPPTTDIYAVDCGTSLAAPVVSGIIALLLPQYRAAFPRRRSFWFPFWWARSDYEVYPSTFRALLAHSAVDISEPEWFQTVDGPVATFDGPDVVTGYGLVDAAAASDVITRREIIEGSLAATCEMKSYPFTVLEPVGGGTPSVRVTLAWDDQASHPLVPIDEPYLVNDLDLVLVDPSGTRHYPWQVNQTITDAASGATLANNAQPCGADISVGRMLPRASALTASQLSAAHGNRGPDHLNTMEQVVASGPAGEWRAEITAFALNSRQPFSLIGIGRLPVVSFYPQAICPLIPGLCAKWATVCDRYPVLCHRPQFHPIAPPGPRLAFRDPNDRIVLPLLQLCQALGVGERCRADGDSVQLDMRLSAPVALGLEIVDARGATVAGGDTPARAHRLTFQVRRDQQYFVLVAPPPGVRTGTLFDTRLTIQRVPEKTDR